MSFTLPGGLGFLNGARLPLEATTAGGVPLNAPFKVYTPLTIQPTNLVPLNAPFKVYTPITIQPTDVVPLNAPFTVRN